MAAVRVPRRPPAARIVAWEAYDTAHHDVLAVTDDPGERDQWLAEITAGDWGGDVVLHGVDASGHAVAVLSPVPAASRT